MVSFVACNLCAHGFPEEGEVLRVFRSGKPSKARKWGIPLTPQSPARPLQPQPQPQRSLRGKLERALVQARKDRPRAVAWDAQPFSPAPPSSVGSPETSHHLSQGVPASPPCPGAFQVEPFSKDRPWTGWVRVASWEHQRWRGRATPPFLQLSRAPLGSLSLPPTPTPPPLLSQTSGYLGKASAPGNTFGGSCSRPRARAHGASRL